MNIFTQIVVTIGRLLPTGVQILGTGFIISNDGLIVTTRHVVGHDSKSIHVIAPKIQELNVYQDTTDTQSTCVPLDVVEVDPFKDLIILKAANIHFSGQLPKITGFDNVSVGDPLAIYGFPHATDGRQVLTYQSTELGAKILLESHGIKNKFGIVNTQARPGQSGSLVFAPKRQEIVGILVGAYAPTLEGGISLGGINPQELHQTTHCISAEYLHGMI